MKTVKLLQPTLVGDVNHPAGETVVVPDDVARAMIAGTIAEPIEGAPSRPAAAPMAEVVVPVLPEQDPLQAARNQSSVVLEHPGLVAAADAGVPGAPKRAGRLVPEPDALTTTPVDPVKPAAKPKG